MINFLITGLSVALVLSIGVAFKKHGTLSAVEASAVREAEKLEALVSKVETSVKEEYSAIVARIKALGL